MTSCDTPEELKLLAEDPKEEKKRRDRIKKMKPERIPWLTRGESGTGIFAQKEKKAENIKVQLQDKELVLVIDTQENLLLEEGLLTQKADFFEEMFNIRPVLRRKKRK